MALPIDELFAKQTRTEVENSILSVATLLGLDVTSWQPGGVARTIIATIAQIGADFTTITSTIAKSGFLFESASATDPTLDDWEDLLGENLYNVARIPAQLATGNVFLTNTSGNTYALAIGDLHVANTATGKTYVNSAAGTILPFGTLTLAVQADEAGSASTATTGQITTMVTQLLGVTVTNPAALVGTDKETNLAYAQRCIDKLSSLSPDGAAGAYAFFVKTIAAPPLSAVITRAKAFSPNTGQVRIIAANAGGAPTVGDLAILTSQVQQSVLPLGISITGGSVEAATTQAIAISVTVYARTSAPLTVQNDINMALTAYIAAIPIGGIELTGSPPGKVFREALVGVIYNANDEIVEVTLATPAADVTLLQTDVAVLSPAPVIVVNTVV